MMRLENAIDYSSAAGIIVADLLESDGDISSDALEYEDRKAQLMEIIDEMTTDAPSWDGELLVISPDAAQTANRFLAFLPSNRELPKVAADGEGNVIFAWEPPHGNCLLTIEADQIHMVDRPGTNFVTHIDAQPFAGNHIPVSILHAIPIK